MAGLDLDNAFFLGQQELFQQFVDWQQHITGLLCPHCIDKFPDPVKLVHATTLQQSQDEEQAGNTGKINLPAAGNLLELFQINLEAFQGLCIIAQHKINAALHTAGHK